MSSLFSARSNISEIMDNLHCNGEVVNQTLLELEVINRWLGGNAVTINGIKKLVDLSQKKTFFIADVGCGGGDILKIIAAWGRRNKMLLNLIGIDANPNIIHFAEVNTKHFPEISLLTQNILGEDFTNASYDIVVATLFTHHFSNKELSNLLRGLHKQTKIGIVINDLHRHWFAYHSIRLLTRWFSKSAMVKYDAPLSVLRSFSRSDLEFILYEAGIKKYTLSWKWAFRWQLIIPTNLA